MYSVTGSCYKTMKKMHIIVGTHQLPSLLNLNL